MDSDASGTAGHDEKLVLGIDTCGPRGSVALARLCGPGFEIVAEIELEGRTYSAMLVSAVGRLLGDHGLGLRQLNAMVVVHGPGSFTGVRVGLSAAKGFAEPTGIPVLAVSRLEVLAWKAGVAASALDAHRQEVYLRMESSAGLQEMLAGRQELAAMESPPRTVATAEEAAALLLQEVWRGTEIVAASAPTAGDALELCAGRVLQGESTDLALLDGHYLRRSDAEIFGEKAKDAKQ